MQYVCIFAGGASILPVGTVNMNKESSDEKLLKLIEGQAKSSGGPKPALSLKLKPKTAKFSLKSAKLKLKLDFNLPCLTNLVCYRRLIDAHICLYPHIWLQE